MTGIKLAELILNTSYRGLSNLEIQFMIFNIVLNHYKNTKIYIMDDDYYLWQLGPIIPNVYERYRKYGSRYIEETYDEVKLDPSYNKGIIIDTIERYSDKRSWEMSEETKEKAFYIKRRMNEHGKSLGDIIPKEWIIEAANDFGRVYD